MVFDTHVHYNLDPLYSDWRRYWKDAQIAGVGGCVVVGTDTDTIHKAVHICAEEPNIYAAIGYHPTDTQVAVGEQELVDLQSLITANKKVVAIGECGLDYHRLPSDPTLAEQEKRRQKILFGRQIHLAHETNLPLIIHSRDAESDLLDTINHFSKDVGKPPHAVLHCMSGTLDYLKQALALGFFISFAGNVTYNSAQSLRELVLQVPLARLLVETDAPFLSPQSRRGHINEPKNIMETAAFLANLLHLNLEKFAQITSENARRFFALP